MEHVSAKNLVQRAQCGDGRAFGFLVETYRHRLDALICVRLGRHLREYVDVEDIAQETWTKALGSIRRFQWRDEGSFFRWLGGIAENVIKNNNSRHSKSPRPLPSSNHAENGAARAADLVEAEEISPSQRLRREERFARLEKALEDLPPDYREVIILSRIWGLPRAEISKRMGRSVDAVSMLQMRAIERLKKLFGKTDSYHLPMREFSLSIESDSTKTQPAKNEGAAESTEDKGTAEPSRDSDSSTGGEAEGT